ncbi:hypothetical protein ASD67_02695 [Sphingopyxis sp. Root1497]|uniref:hypothetical protein n=1 Tax=Sphingopyxis sp. Root1497 TaxID=1736474 RepID=UPI0006FEB7AD|nr:hypothetical protein [Sphingopyxis sp. Root1497]KQZ65332.1 hypothetical protein ASD67_02695 [Sphingopyxis sp. Root1497]
MNLWKTALAAAWIAALPFASAAADPAASAPEPVEILPIAFSAEGLSGPGGDRLRAELADVQFIALGEDHGFAGSPELGMALAHDVAALPGAAPLYHAVEVGPVTTRWAGQTLRDGGPDALGKSLAGRPFAMPFLSNVEDAKLAAPFAANDRLWGIDQEFVGSPTILLDLLAERAKDKATTELLAGWRDKDKTALGAGRFDAIMLQTTTPAGFADLRSRFAGDVEALAIVDALAKSAAIYQLNDSGRYLENNEVRAALMRGYFLRAWRGAAPNAPTVLFKMGAYHMGRGTTPTSIYDIGSLLPGLAAANGKTSIHIAYVPLAGMVRTVKPSPTAFTAVVPYEDEAIGPILDAAGIARDSLPATGHVLIPLAPLRHKLQGKALRELPSFPRFMLLGYDYLVTTRDAKPATHFEAR